MECNKEEAFRAKEMAEKEMENKDFLRARKIAIKAQNLYPELENISQLIMVCDVHCSAGNKVHGTEMDWYGILKIEPTADDVLIKKQFRKFALFLHPDKNKFAGAADAFKLIGESQRLLLDREKRRIHDMKCRYAAVNGALKQASIPPNVRRPPGHVNANKQLQQAPRTSQTGSSSNQPTFWTACPFCYIRYQYYRDVLNKTLNCQTCGKSFTGYEIYAQLVPQKNWSQPAFTKQSGASNQAFSKVGPRRNIENSTAKVEVRGNSGIGNTQSSKVAPRSKQKEKRGDVSINCNQKRKAEKPQPCGSINGKKKRKQFSESSEINTESEEEVSFEIDGFYSEQFPRTRSSRSKRNVSYTENLNDENDIAEPADENKSTDASHVALSSDEEEQMLQSDANDNTFDNPNEDSCVAPDEAYEIPDPEFYNFDADKSFEKFEIGQVWALYSDEDGLPKYYGKINKIDLLPEHKLHVAWLGVGSTPNGMIQWTDKKMPITCGRFKLRKMKPSQYTSTASFSHQVIVREIRDKKEEFVILPRKGEVWALYKGWNAGMKCSDLENCDYDMVEVVEENHSGMSVLSLEVVDGFKSVFRVQVTGQLPVRIKIPSNELLRFSHQIPAFRLTEERGGCLRGYVELDPAALPLHWFSSD